MSDWQKGSLVLCVRDDAIQPLEAGLWVIKKGGIYTIENVGVDPADGGYVLTLAGIDAIDTEMGAYCSSRFRLIPPLSPEEHASYIVQLAQDQRVTEKAR